MMKLVALIPFAFLVSGCGPVDEGMQEDDSTEAALSTAVTQGTNVWQGSRLAPSQLSGCEAICLNQVGGKEISDNVFGFQYYALSYCESVAHTAEANALKTHPAAVCFLVADSAQWEETGVGPDPGAWVNFCPGSWSVAECNAAKT
jgi:hypothetical protein